MAEESRPDPLAPPEGYGQRGVRPGNTVAPLPDGCSVEMIPGTFCSRPMVVIFWWGDEAEHITPLGYCRAHAATTWLASRMNAGRCTACGFPAKIVRAEPEDWDGYLQDALAEIRRQR